MNEKFAHSPDLSVEIGPIGPIPTDRTTVAVVLRHVADLSEAETADALGCSVGHDVLGTDIGLARRP